MCSPEEEVITQGDKADKVFFLYKGECEVTVTNHLKRIVLVRGLEEGDYFGEIGLLYEEMRTATVQSTNFCTMAYVMRDPFFEIITRFGELWEMFKEKSLNYDENDVWKSFKVLLLKQIDYMSPESNVYLDEAFYSEIQFYMKEENYPKGTEIFSQDTPCTSILFVVQGKIDLQVKTIGGNTTTISTL